MAQGPSWEACGCLAGQEMYCLISGKFKIASSIYGYKLRTAQDILEVGFYSIYSHADPFLVL
jgi:hypothetical protein